MAACLARRLRVLAWFALLPSASGQLLAAWAVRGDGSLAAAEDGTPSCASKDAQHSVRCCLDAGGCISVCSSSDPGPSGTSPITSIDPHDATWAQAKAECEAQSGHLCTLDEINPGGGASSPCLNTGCLMNTRLVWTGSECGPPSPPLRRLWLLLSQ